MEYCRNCNKELTDSNWAVSLKKHNSKICKDCHNEIGKAWRKNNRKRVNELSLVAYYRNPKIHHARVAKSRQNIRIETLLAYGGQCSCCDVSDLDVLEIDHIYNDGASDRKKNLFAYNLYRKLKKEGFPKDRYQVLCRNCNWKKELDRRRNK